MLYYVITFYILLQKLYVISNTVSIYQVSSVQLVTDKKLEALNKAEYLLTIHYSGPSIGLISLAV